MPKSLVATRLVLAEDLTVLLRHSTDAQVLSWSSVECLCGLCQVLNWWMIMMCYQAVNVKIMVSLRHRICSLSYWLLIWRRVAPPCGWLAAHSTNKKSLNWLIENIAVKTSIFMPRTVTVYIHLAHKCTRPPKATQFQESESADILKIWLKLIWYEDVTFY